MKKFTQIKESKSLVSNFIEDIIYRRFITIHTDIQLLSSRIKPKQK